MAVQPVQINVSGTTITCLPPTVKVAKNVDTVQWSCTDDFTIKITGQAPIPATGSGSHWTASGGPWPNTTNPPAKRTIKYSVTVGGNTLDPDIEVQP